MGAGSGVGRISQYASPPTTATTMTAAPAVSTDLGTERGCTGRGVTVTGTSYRRVPLSCSSRSGSDDGPGG
ncbi:hypothetical protein MPUL_28820 [Mycolicibacterium pulveris]|uniref:Uncharacterized protein n=1 Tax=Mycolicibacterium pulveris TaxID=36813 RepID=A0A7I7UJU7_MYCPV|nr:hypothetical protein MPUL_28820 [Mycolicibacterium pulveris]